MAGRLFSARATLGPSDPERRRSRAHPGNGNSTLSGTKTDQLAQK
jgi:hypothetical protein